MELFLRKTLLLYLLTDKDGKVSWEEFKKGHFSDDGKDDETKEQIKEDGEKFKFADEDGDGKLDLEEYMAFYHPGVRKTASPVTHAHPPSKGPCSTREGTRLLHAQISNAVILFSSPDLFSALHTKSL